MGTYYTINSVARGELFLFFRPVGTVRFERRDGGATASEERGFAGVGEALYAARRFVEAGQAERSSLSSVRSANPNDETERQLPRIGAAVRRAVLRSGGQQFTIAPTPKSK